MRAVQRKNASDPETPTEKYMMFGHADVHRLLKDLVTAECAGQVEGTDAKLPYSTQIAKILMKNFEDAISTRAVFILIALIENPATKSLVFKQLKDQKAEIQAEFKKGGSKASGLKILIKKLIK